MVSACSYNDLKKFSNAASFHKQCLCQQAVFLNKTNTYCTINKMPYNTQNKIHLLAYISQYGVLCAMGAVQ